MREASVVQEVPGRFVRAEKDPHVRDYTNGPSAEATEEASRAFGGVYLSDRGEDGGIDLLPYISISNMFHRLLWYEPQAEWCSPSLFLD